MRYRQPWHDALSERFFLFNIRFISSSINMRSEIVEFFFLSRPNSLQHREIRWQHKHVIPLENLLTGSQKSVDRLF